MTSAFTRVAGVSRLLSAIVATVAILILTGWLLDVRALTQPIAGASSVKANTAIALLAVAASLWLQSSKHAPHGAAALAMFAAVIGVLSGGQALFGWRLGIDELVVGDPTVIDQNMPGRMSPLTAACLITAGFGATCAARRSLVWLSQSLALITLLVSASALLGYLYGVHETYRGGSLNTISAPTAVLLLMGAVGILLLEPGEGFTGVLSSDTLGGQTARLTLPATILILIIVGWIHLEGLRIGRYDTALGIALLVLNTIAMLSAVIWTNARVIGEVDTRRHAAENALRAANETLEARVAQKAEELERTQEQARQVEARATAGRYDVASAGDGATALTMIGTQHFDVLLADLRMPNMDGLTLVRTTRRQAPNVAVVILTAASSEASAIEAVNLGVSGYVLKPFRVPQILEVVDRALSRQRVTA